MIIQLYPKKYVFFKNIQKWTNICGFPSILTRTHHSQRATHLTTDPAGARKPYSWRCHVDVFSRALKGHLNGNNPWKIICNSGIVHCHPLLWVDYRVMLLMDVWICLNHIDWSAASFCVCVCVCVSVYWTKPLTACCESSSQVWSQDVTGCHRCMHLCLHMYLDTVQFGCVSVCLWLFMSEHRP